MDHGQTFNHVQKGRDGRAHPVPAEPRASFTRWLHVFPDLVQLAGSPGLSPSRPIAYLFARPSTHGRSIGRAVLEEGLGTLGVVSDRNCARRSPRRKPNPSASLVCTKPLTVLSRELKARLFQALMRFLCSRKGRGNRGCVARPVAYAAVEG